MSGPIGLHGGGEYLAGDEPFLDALLEAAAAVAAQRSPDDTGGPGNLDVAAHVLATPGDVIRIVILPTAAGRGQPDRAAATGRAAFERRAAHLGLRTTVEVARVVDAASAADPVAVERVARADLIHLPGGDPDLVPATLAGSLAFSGLCSAWERGAVIAGASAGAMALADWSWTSDGGIRGLGLLRGLAVVPHYDDVRRTSWQATLDELAPGGIGYLGLDERTGVLSVPNGPGGHDWRVVGEGAALWFARGADEPIVGRHGDLLRLPF
jgi:cyanophycinase